MALYMVCVRILRLRLSISYTTTPSSYRVYHSVVVVEVERTLFFGQVQWEKPGPLLSDLGLGPRVSATSLSTTLCCTSVGAHLRNSCSSLLITILIGHIFSTCTTVVCGLIVTTSSTAPIPQMPCRLDATPGLQTKSGIASAWAML